MDRDEIDRLRHIPITQLTEDDLAIPEVFKEAIKHAYTQGEINHLLEFASIDFLTPHIEKMVDEQLISIEHIPFFFLHYYDIAYMYVKQDVSNMTMLPEDYRDNEEFIASIALSDGRIIEYASQRVLRNEDILKNAVFNNAMVFKHVPEKFKTVEMCFLAFKDRHMHNGENWNYVPSRLKNDREFIMEVGKVCPKIYQFLDSEIRDSYEMAQFFLQAYGGNLKYASEKNKNDATLVAPLLEKGAYYLKHAGENLRNNPNFIIPVLKKYPEEIFNCGDGIRNNIEIAKMLCQAKYRVSPSSISFFSEQIKSDVTVAMLSLLADSRSMNFISKRLSSDREFVMEYIRQGGFDYAALYYISKELTNDRELMLLAYDRNSESIQYVGDKLKHDKDFLNIVFENNVLLAHRPRLFKNLKWLNLKEGDEDILLSFFENSNINFNNPNDRLALLQQITDKNFLSILKEQDDLYKYAKSVTLMNRLEKDLSPKEKVKQNKI